MAICANNCHRFILRLFCRFRTQRHPVGFSFLGKRGFFGGVEGVMIGWAMKTPGQKWERGGLGGVGGGWLNWACTTFWGAPIFRLFHPIRSFSGGRNVRSIGPDGVTIGLYEQLALQKKTVSNFRNMTILISLPKLVGKVPSFWYSFFFRCWATILFA